MSGTREGGKKAAETIRKKHGANFYAEIGRRGGMRSVTGGFASEKKGSDGLTGPQRAKIAGRIGGQASKRGSAR